MVIFCGHFSQRSNCGRYAVTPHLGVHSIVQRPATPTHAHKYPCSHAGHLLGVLFKLELVPYGYTFVGKGTLSCYRRRLEHESRVYTRLNRIQGMVVPAHLDMVQMARGHVLPGGARVVHMMLMSWGGEEASDVSASDLTAEVRRYTAPSYFCLFSEQYCFVSSTLTVSQPCRWLFVMIILSAGLRRGLVALARRPTHWVDLHVTVGSLSAAKGGC